MKWLLPVLTLALGGRPAAASPAVDETGLSAPAASLQAWNDWRFGLFIHWGPWSQTQIGYIWKIVNEDPPEIRAQRFELYRTFNPTNFDPHKWARAAKAAGMKYVVFVTKHHDGFNNFDTALSDFKITGSGSPYRDQPQADLTRAVIDAFRAEGLGIGLYYSHIDWHHPDGRLFSVAHWDFDPQQVDRNPAAWRRFVDYEQGQLRELLTRYGKIDVLWFDINWPFADYGRKHIAHPQVRQDVLETLRLVRSLQPGILIDDRGTDVFGDFETPEQQIPATPPAGSWESCITITEGKGFWFKGAAAEAKDTRQLVRALIEIASKGGNFLLNVGPGPDGELAPAEYAALSGVGAWMRINHESIHGTQRSPLPEVPWGRITSKPGTLYLHVFDWPGDGLLDVPGLEGEIKRAYFLADSDRRPLTATRAGSGNRIALGRTTAPDPIASVVVVELANAR